MIHLVLIQKYTFLKRIELFSGHLSIIKGDLNS